MATIHVRWLRNLCWKFNSRMVRGSIIGNTGFRIVRISKAICKRKNPCSAIIIPRQPSIWCEVASCPAVEITTVHLATHAENLSDRRPRNCVGHSVPIIGFQIPWPAKTWPWNGYWVNLSSSLNNPAKNVSQLRWSFSVMNSQWIEKRLHSLSIVPSCKTT